MKTSAMLFVICLFVHQNLWGKIRNGYDEIEGVRQLLFNLHNILEEDQGGKKLSIFQKDQLKIKIRWLHEYIAHYELTEQLLAQFRAIAPDLYHEIDTIKDREGRSTDVYVKFMPEEEMRVSVSGTTNIDQAAGERHAYHSEYGAHTVSVRIVIGKKCLWLLAHELGHVQYQVPHLSSYVAYYTAHYQDHTLRANDMRANYIGHNTKDPSGNQAHAYEERFREHFLSYRKNNKDEIIEPLVLLQEIRNSVNDEPADF